jgi:predicted NBD/HSP70 family sugar kinase
MRPASQDDVLVYEIGGSTMRAARYDPGSGALAGQIRRTTPSYQTMPQAGAAEILAAVFEAMAAMAAGSGPAAAIAVGWPGPVSPGGIAHASPTILGGRLDRPCDVGRAIAARSGGCRVHVANELTATAWRYAARIGGDFCLVNLGSGVGGGELGHFTVDPAADAPICECGGRGHLAGIASGRGAMRHCRRMAAADPQGFATSAMLGSTIESAAIARAFHAGDAWTAARIEETAAPLARALAGLHAAIGIERFVLIGGWARALGDRFQAMLVRLAREACWALGQDWASMIEPGHDDDDDGLIGAGLMAQAYISSQRCV